MTTHRGFTHLNCWSCGLVIALDDVPAWTPKNAETFDCPRCQSYRVQYVSTEREA